jgi:hypothetical protein
MKHPGTISAKNRMVEREFYFMNCLARGDNISLLTDSAFDSAPDSAFG